MNIIIGTWIEVVANSIVKKTTVPQCSKDVGHSSVYYFARGNYCPVCGNKITYVEVEERIPSEYVKDIIPNYSGTLVIFDYKNHGKTNTHIIYDSDNDSVLYTKILTESDCSGAYYIDETMWKSEQIEETRDEFLRFHSSTLVALDNLKIQYELITGVGIFDW